MQQTFEQASHLKVLSFYKDNGIWYADLPEFLAAGLGTRANLMMVDGSDTLLDFLSGFRARVSIKIAIKIFDGHDAVLLKEGLGMNMQLLDDIGHARVNYGAYYNISHFKGLLFKHRLWLCPVTEYVFGGTYPDEIYIAVIA